MVLLGLTAGDLPNLWRKRLIRRASRGEISNWTTTQISVVVQFEI